MMRFGLLPIQDRTDIGSLNQVTATASPARVPDGHFQIFLISVNFGEGES